MVQTDPRKTATTICLAGRGAGLSSATHETPIYPEDIDTWENIAHLRIENGDIVFVRSDAVSDVMPSLVPDVAEPIHQLMLMAMGVNLFELRPRSAGCGMCTGQEVDVPVNCESAGCFGQHRVSGQSCRCI
jgi:hypothetical protein